MKSTTKPSLTLLSFVALCFLAFYGTSTYTRAVAVPSRRQLSFGGSLYGRERGDEKVVKRATQKPFQVSNSCKVSSDKKSASSSSSSTATKGTSTVASSKTKQTTATSTATTIATTTSISTTKETQEEIILTSNSATYGKTELTADLNSIIKWADDEGNLTNDEKVEVVDALLSASARYYPEMPTQAICRIMLADIKTESDFNPKEISGARLDSGTSWGLLQVSPNGASQELTLFQDHSNAVTHNFTYGMPADVRAGIRGPLLDYDTGKELVLSNLTKDDLFRPWINIHVAMWIQSNLARSSSQDPYNWAAINDYSWSLKVQTLSSSDERVANKYQTLLKGASLPTTIRTGLGSWVAGPATDGTGSYLQSGDDISTQYLNTIMDGVRHLYGVTSAAKMPKAWLDTYPINAGLVDYRTYY